MKTTITLSNADVYVSGKPVYRGSIGSLYGSTYHETITIQPQISNAGKIVLPTDDELKSSCSKLQKGQIGARKVMDSTLTGSTSVISEVVCECNNLNIAAGYSKNGKSIEDWLEPVLKYTDSEGKQHSLKEVIAMRRNYLNSNKEIRDSIEDIKRSYNWKEGTRMSDSLMRDIADQMKNYVSMTGMDLVITVHDKHVINLTDDYVKCNDLEGLERIRKEANYNRRGNRLVARNTPIKVVIPIQNLEQVAIIKEKLTGGMRTCFNRASSEWVASERFNPQKLDLEAARLHDEQLNR